MVFFLLALSRITYQKAGAPRQATGSGIDPLELPVTITVTVGNESVRPQGKDFSA